MKRSFLPEKIEAAALVLLFCAALLAPLVYQWIHPAREKDLIEKRDLEKWPRFPKKWKRLSNWDNYPARFEKFYNDHFGFRDALLQGDAWVRRCLFRASPTENVLYGKRGWYFYQAEECLSDYRGLMRLSPEQLQNWLSRVEARQRWLAARGIHYILVFAPNKQTIYPEFLPVGVTKLREDTRVDQLIAFLRAHSTVTIVDTRSALLAGKHAGQLFYRTDTHWNSLGAFVAYQQILREMQKVTPELSPPTFRGMQAKPYELHGDLAQMSRSGNEVESSPVTVNQIKITAEPMPFPDGTVVPRDALQSIDYPGAATKMRAVFFRDSYSNALRPYFSPHFARSVYVWRKFEPGRTDERRLAEVVEQEKPQWFVEEMVERFVGQDVPAASDVFGGVGGAVAFPGKSP